MSLAPSAPPRGARSDQAVELPRAGASADAACRSRLLSCTVLAVVAAATLLTQCRLVGFQPGHHGWVTAHGLAIISNATADSGWLGYTARLRSASGEASYYYFDRYPVVFSAAMHSLLQFAGEPGADQIFLARQLMNLIFLATLVAGYLLVRLLIADRLAALAATLLCFSGYYCIYYKDMVHFDQPAVLGFVVLLYAVSWQFVRGRSRWVYAAGLFAVLLGRGYASFAILAVWIGIDLLGVLRERPRENLLAGVLRSDAVRVSCVCFIVATSALAYNIATESRITGAAWYETSIVSSAQRRLGFEASFDRQIADDLTWGRFAERQIKQLARSVTPYAVSREAGMSKTVRRVIQFVLAGTLVYLLVNTWRTADPQRQKIFALLVLSGFVWMIPMRRLTYFHDYTTLYYLGLSLALFAALAGRVAARRAPSLLAAALVVFALSLVLVRQDENSVARQVNPTTRDFDRIRPLLADTDAVCVAGGPFSLSPEVRYDVAYYVSPLWLSALAVEPYVLTRNRDHAGQNLTPENSEVFLFRQSSRGLAASGQTRQATLIGAQ